MENILLTQKAIDIIKKSIGVNNLSEVLDKEYKDISEINDIDKKRVKLYSNKIRGSVRLGSLNFLTIKEFNERADRILNAQLP
jgi:hypothetical protein